MPPHILGQRWLGYLRPVFVVGFAGLALCAAAPIPDTPWFEGMA